MYHREFLFGASTSAYQVEGGNSNADWWGWEKKRPSHLHSGRAADFWHLYKEDIAMARTLGHNAQRISLEWSRIEPVMGRFNPNAIAHYRAILTDMKRCGMKTFVTLHHFTNPTWLASRGGWESARTPELFERYVSYVGQRLGDLVDVWITINEPMVYASKSYWKGDWPPQGMSMFRMLRVLLRMVQGHRRAYRALHRVLRHPTVGIAQNCIAFLSPIQNFLVNQSFFFFTRKMHDVIGVNYYFAHHASSLAKGTSDLGWPIVPQGLTDVLLKMKRYRLPIYVTENGLADADDSRRSMFIREHIRAIEDAQKQGADVRGYLHWSLIDNFEWAEGFTPRFGLIAVDYETLKRTIRPSAYVFKAIIEQSQSVVS